jgi:hypothetical protein
MELGSGPPPIAAILNSVSEGRQDFSASAASLGRVALNSAATGRLKKGDRDWFAVSLEAGQSYRFQLTSVGKRTSPELILRNAAGVEVARSTVSAGGRCRFSFDSTSSDIFYLDAGNGRRAKSSYEISAAFEDPRTRDLLTGLLDDGIRDRVDISLNDNRLSKSELREILASAGDDGGVAANELSDLRSLGAVLSRYLDPNQSAYLSDIYSNVVESNPANSWWSGGGSSRTALGDLQAGSSTLTLERLLAKWFDGADLPVNVVGTDTRFGYARATGSLFVDDVALADVNQGQAVTCYLLAAAQLVAESMPNLINAMFRDNGDGTYGVRFYASDQSSFWVTVNSSLPINGSGQLLLAGNTTKNPAGELWVSLLEKAYAQANETGWLGRDLAINSYQAVEGGGFDALSHLTGGSLTAYSAYYSAASGIWAGTTSSWTLAETAAQDALSRGQSLWLASYGSSTGSNGLANLVTHHAFTISSYNSVTGRYLLHNAWGASGGGSWNSSFEVTWTDLFNARAIVAWV